MSKHNRGTVKAPVRSAVTSAIDPTARTALGAQGYTRDSRSELFLLAACNLPGEKAYHERPDERVRRFHDLVRACSAAEPDWTAGLLGWLRGPGSMRLAPVEAAADYAHARWKEQGNADAATADATARRVVASVLQRADEPGEIMAYWLAAYGRKMPIGFKRGVADAVLRLYSERSLLKYDTPEAAVRFGDVIELVQPRYLGGVHGTWRDELYRHAIERRHGRDDPERNAVPASLATIRRFRAMMSLPAGERAPFLRTPEAVQVIKDAGVTWEALAGWLQGPMDAAAWEAVVPSMGLMGLTRNLRNFDQAGVSDAVAQAVSARLADAQEVLRSRQFPYRFLSAYRAAPSLRWAWPLEQALTHSLAAIPSLPGRTLVLVDRSPSMWRYKFSEHSDMDWADAASLFAAAIALRAEQADLAEFWAASKRVTFTRGESVLKVMGKFSDRPAPGGTDIPLAVRTHLRPDHARVVIITDEQTQPGYLPSNCLQFGQRVLADSMPATLIDDLIPKSVPLYMWNFGGYKAGAVPSGSGNRHTLGGLTDAAFRAVPLLEANRDATWPWLAKGAA